MKKPVILLLLVTGLSYARAQTPNEYEDYTCAGNTLTMNFRLCMDMTEVSGLMYRSFLEDMQAKHGKTSREFADNLPDFRTWETLFPGKTMDEISRLFLEEDELALMPVVGISYEQAKRFCDWRTERFKEELSKMDPDERARFPKNFKFRLPTAKEWARIRFMQQDKRMLKQMDKMSANNLKVFKMKKNKLLNNNLRIAHIYNTSDPKIGLYNLFDNVAEMTAEKGVAMGGSWRLANDEMRFDREFKYAVPAAWLGFRCIFEIID